MDKTRSWIPTLVVGTVIGFMGCLILMLLTGGIRRMLSGSSLAPTRAIVTKIQTLNELVTVRYLIEKIVKLEAEPSVLGRDRVVLLTHAVVKAGIDLSAIRPEDVRVEGTKISLTLPAARITDCYLDEKRTEVWEHQTAFWRKFDQNLEQNARRQALEEIRLSAGEQGIQKEAMDRARVQLGALMRSFGYTEVEFRAP